MEVLLRKLPTGALAPIDEEQAAKVAKLKAGGLLRCDVKQMRNARFFRKWWVLAKYVYDLWADSLPQTLEYRGQRVQPDFERFRKDLTIMAGFYEPVFAADGTMRVQALSLAWGSMSEEEFEKLYSATIQAALDRIQVLSQRGITDQQLRNYVDQVLAFD